MKTNIRERHEEARYIRVVRATGSAMRRSGIVVGRTWYVYVLNFSKEKMCREIIAFGLTEREAVRVRDEENDRQHQCGLPCTTFMDAE